MAREALERLSIGEPIEGAHVVGVLDLDPLVVSRWLCGEDMRGVYQPVVLHGCVIEALDVHGRTFYETVELMHCIVTQARFSQAYFYSNLLIEDTHFKGMVDASHLQADGRVVIHNTVFSGYVDFSDLLLHQFASLSTVRFVGGTNLLHEVFSQRDKHFSGGVSLQESAFRPEDVPPGFDLAAHQIALLTDEEIKGRPPG